MRAYSAGLLVVVSVLMASASAQTNLNGKADLEFPKQAAELSMFSPLQMGLWKPEGAGPFPAVVLFHSCGGVGSENLRHWRKEAIKRGHAVLMMDSFTPRGSPNCRPVAPATMDRGVKDVFDATAYLGALPFIDPGRIAVVGFSWGAMAGMLSASAQYGGAAAPGMKPPAAVVALYPSCVIAPFGSFGGNEYLRQDVGLPTLVLMGSDDTESPADECVNRLVRLKDRAAPVEWQVYKSATHCWDCSDKHNFRWSPPWAEGRAVIYRYDSDVTARSTDAAFEFLARLPPGSAKK